MGQLVQEIRIPQLWEKAPISVETTPLNISLSPPHRPYVPGQKVYPRSDPNPSTHTMGDSLPQYLKIKVHQSILEKAYDEIMVVSGYNRYEADSIAFDGEKRDKPFNWERPTARVVPGTNTLLVECFPGYDHIEHYAEIIAAYLRVLEGQGITNLTPSSRVSFIPASCSDTLRALVEKTNLADFPGEGIDTVILGLVWHLPNLTGEEEWKGTGPWQWILKTFDSGRRVAFLGFRPAFWGDISGEVVHYLAARFSVKEVIYLGKLGVLKAGVSPNNWLATGGRSLVSGRVVEWENVLTEAVASTPSAAGCVMAGDHVTLGSVLHETKNWHADLKEAVDFVDPEIGMMAQAAVRSGIRYGYLHMITDNLGQKYDEDLSNERTESVLVRRARLHQVVKDVMAVHLARPL
ncbi:hypothetical protein B0H66DRAFT_385549 [Apodospora peruviana]|uniref:Nucleoside phosphorylase domain-containing protein n=1 Tax=Apodospora peruviana TaxID=516989 RepID=A0AAE0HUD8_9PEZI|nr:hypothetical protein B0H66DRAFT_385549 [Apodospora peruviana]